MFKQRIFIFSLIALIFLAVMHFIGIKFEIYFHFEKYDIPMHILGGLWISLTAFWLAPFLLKDCSITNYKTKSLILGLISVTILAVAWEIFELAFNITSVSDQIFIEDTVGDFLCAFIGLLIGYIYFLNQKRCVGGVCELVKPTSSITSINLDIDK